MNKHATEPITIKTKVKISCFDCKKLGVTCAAMRTPSKSCFAPKKQRVVKG